MNAFDSLAVLEKIRKASGPFGMVKAHSEEGNEDNYERALSNIAHAYIKDNVPDLLQYQLGFQLVEKSEDNNKALGVFGFKIGNLVIYIPVFFINGEIKGTDLAYVYNGKKFLPASQKIIRFLLSKAKNMEGEPIAAFSLSGLAQYPNLMQLKPTTLKWASTQPAWMRGFIGPMIDAKYCRHKEPKFPVLDLLSKSASAANYLVGFLDRYPRLIPLFYEYYGPDLNRSLKKAAAPPRYPDIYDKDWHKVRDYPATLDSSAQPADVEIYQNIHDDAWHKLSQSDLEKLRQQGYLILDKRGKTTVIRKRQSDFKRGAGGISVPGFYHLLLRDLSTVCAYVVPIVNEELGNKQSVQIDSDTGWKGDLHTRSRATFYPAEFLVIPIYRADEKGGVLEKYSGKNGIICNARDIVYVSYPKDDSKHSIKMFPSVNEFSGTEANNVPIAIFTRYSSTPKLYARKVQDKHHRGRRLLTFESSAVIIDPNVNDRIEVRKNFLDNAYDDAKVAYYVPTDARYVYVGDYYTARVTPWSEKNKERKDSKIEELRLLFVSASELPSMLMKHASGELKISKRQDGYHINNYVLLTRKEALFNLVSTYGLSEKDASDALNDAETSGEELIYDYKLPDIEYTVRFSKRAQDPLLNANPQLPNVFPPPLPTQQAPIGNWGPNPVVTANEGFVPAGTGNYRQPKSLVEPLEPRPLLDQMIQRAISSGQKEVFDTTVFTTLLATTDDKELIDAYIPKALDGLDALGHILFNMYMHREKFEERFGRERLKEIEESLRQLFRRVGELLVELMERPALSQGLSANRILMGM